MSTLLLHVEDPGAVNVMAPLADPLRRAGHTVCLLAASPVQNYLADRGLGFDGAGDDPAQAFDSARPDLLLVGTSENPRGPGLAMIDAARTRKVPSIGAIDMLANAANRFRGLGDSPLAHAPDWLAVPDAPTAEAYAALGFDVERIVTCGHPHYDVVRARRTALEAVPLAERRAVLFPDVGLETPIVVFLAEAVDQLDPSASRVGSDCAFSLPGESDDRTTVILNAVLDALDTLPVKPHVVLRLHPKNGENDYAGFHGRIDRISRGGDPLDLIGCADLVIGMTTFLLVEASLLGRPTLSVLPRAEEAAWLPTTAGGVTPVATVPDNLRSLLGEALAGGTVDGNAFEDLMPSGAAGRYVDLVQGLLRQQVSAA